MRMAHPRISPTHRLATALLYAGLLVAASGCPDDAETEDDPFDAPQHGPVASGIHAPMGEILPSATDEQRATFERGRKVALHEFTRADGLGPAFNVTSCAGCHERPTVGGSAGTYRNFFIGFIRLPDDSLLAAESAGSAQGVIRAFYQGAEYPARPPLDPLVNVLAQRNPVPFFGTGLIAELPESAIERHADPNDSDGDGVSGRVNSEDGFIGRFGRKAQTSSIEGFIRGPLFNHMGVTSTPLTNEQNALLPVDSSLPSAKPGRFQTIKAAQSSAPDEPNKDDDGVDDPELSQTDLFDLVSFAMLLAVPPFDPPTEQSERGRKTFDSIGCASCHVPRLYGPRGPIPIYSDLLVHDMGPDLADGLEQGRASGREFRTQPLWGIAAVGPYLHDGRAGSLSEAILAHGGEGQGARDRFAALTESGATDVIAFLNSLGGSSQYSPGLLVPGAPVPAPMEYGGPRRDLDDEDATRFEEGRAMFDREFTFAEGLGQPRFNGDSCRACHFKPVIGGAGPAGVNVMRHGIQGPAGFTVPAVGTILHKQTALIGNYANAPQPDATIFESRQTPHLFGLGLIESITDETILAGADPDDTITADGISGKPSWTDGGRLGRFGWKAQVPSIAEFVRDAVTAELGMTLPYRDDLTFGKIHDNDGVADPELGEADAAALEFFLTELSPPPRQDSATSEAAKIGETTFETIGCAACHTPSLPGANGPVPLYSDLLLHETMPPDSLGIEEASAGVREFRTPPLWGLATSAPYLHSGLADTITDAILAHHGEAKPSREAWLAITPEERAALIEFLESL
ncbi:MAG: CxxC motif-containing protein (DUF1111 family) [Myxococcota bacterium]|jgi:CxxC motif-containing protein (DUF1111 family)